MKMNVGTVDKVLRIVLGLVLLSLVFFGPKSYWGLVGLVLIATALSNWCPVYSLFGLSTKGQGAKG
jgi:hypothetical protein